MFDDGIGIVVGYCIGCFDVDDFCVCYDIYRIEVLDLFLDIKKFDDFINWVLWIDFVIG